MAQQLEEPTRKKVKTGVCWSSSIGQSHGIDTPVGSLELAKAKAEAKAKRSAQGKSRFQAKAMPNSKKGKGKGKNGNGKERQKAKAKKDKSPLERSDSDCAGFEVEQGCCLVLDTDFHRLC